MIYGNKMGLGNRFVRFCCVIEIGAKANGINISKYLPKSALNWTDSSVTHIPADVYFTVTHSICTLKFNCTIAILMLLLLFFDKKIRLLNLSTVAFVRQNKNHVRYRNRIEISSLF